MAESKPDMRAVLATPEAQAAIKEAAAQAAQTAIAEMTKGGPIPGVDEQTRSLFSEMALAIAQMSNQGSGRSKPIAPEVIQRRLAAAERCEALLAEVHRNIKRARDDGDVELQKKWTPEYRVTSKVNFNERMIEPFRRGAARGDRPVAQDIVWTGMPNHALRPLNRIAEELHSLFLESVGSVPRLKPLSGPNGGQVAQDTRPFWMTPGGLVVQGDAPPRIERLGGEFANELGALDNNDPNAPEVHVLGTIAPPARQNFADQMLGTKA